MTLSNGLTEKVLMKGLAQRGGQGLGNQQVMLGHPGSSNGVRCRHSWSQRAEEAEVSPAPAQRPEEL